jgi:hypothetical protein
MQAYGGIIAMFLQDAGLLLEGVDIGELCDAVLDVNFSKIGDGGSMGNANRYPKKHW